MTTISCTITTTQSHCTTKANITSPPSLKSSLSHCHQQLQNINYHSLLVLVHLTLFLLQPDESQTLSGDLIDPRPVNYWWIVKSVVVMINHTTRKPVSSLFVWGIAMHTTFHDIAQEKSHLLVWHYCKAPAGQNRAGTDWERDKDGI